VTVWEQAIDVATPATGGDPDRIERTGDVINITATPKTVKSSRLKTPSSTYIIYAGEPEPRP